ncbi:MAG: hypothetical protein U1E76_21695 [Planctomycetota bacterium]
MNPNSRGSLLAAATLSLSLATACSDSVADAPLAASRAELLDLAFRTAAAIPVEPHVKSRSRAQDAVVAACLELDQPRRALGYVEHIDNWRRGAAYADLAFYCAQHGRAGDAPHYLDLAGKIAESPECDSPQDWRRDRIRVKIAGTLVWLGQIEKAAAFEVGLVNSEVGKVQAVKAMLIDAAAFDEQMAELERVVATENFDQVQNALATCAQLFNRFYDDAGRRARVEQAIRASWTKSKLPISVRFDSLIELAGFALGHHDAGKALDLAHDAELMIAGSKWLPENQIPLMARLAGLRCRAGDAAAARREADAALQLFDASRDRIVDIARAGALRPVAEAYQVMGDTAAALAVYRRAVEEGARNPNARPRAEDLCATCCSMALLGVEPDARLHARMLQIHGALGQPW